MKSLLVLLACSLVACSGTLEETKGKLHMGNPMALSSPERCESLSDSQRVWGGIAAGTAVLSGASGLTAIPAEGKVETALGVASLLVGGLSAASAFEAQTLATQWSGECTK